MTYVIEPHISSYIDQAIERQRVIFSAEMKHERELIFEKFQSDVKTMGETVDFKIRETTREVIREEVTPRFEILETKMDMVIGEIGSINGKIESIENEMRSYRKDTDDFKEEMRALRKDTNRHNLRLTRLERALA